MRHAHNLLAVPLVFAALAVPAVAQAKKFDNDGNHSSIEFTAKTVLFKVNGRFDKYNLAIEGDPQALGPVQVKLEIDVKSIDTNNKTRDEHLRSPDFFDAKKFPKIVFTGTKASREGDKVIVEGTLEMHGVKKEMKIPFSPMVAKNGAGVEEHSYQAELVLHRKEFGIGNDSIGARISLADEVRVELMIAGFFQ